MENPRLLSICRNFKNEFSRSKRADFLEIAIFYKRLMKVIREWRIWIYQPFDAGLDNSIRKKQIQFGIELKRIFQTIELHWREFLRLLNWIEISIQFMKAPTIKYTARAVRGRSDIDSIIIESETKLETTCTICDRTVHETLDVTSNYNRHFTIQFNSHLNW